MIRRGQLGARWLVLPLAIALILDALFYTGYLASDDNGYLSSAYRVVHGEPMQAYVGSVRAGMTLPVIALYWFADGRVHLIATAFLLMHPLLVVLVYVAGRMSHGSAVARVAALLTAVCPFLYVFAGAILPDLLMTAGIMVSLIAVMMAIERRAPIWSLLAGVALGLGYSVKETALVMAVPALVSLMVAMRRDRKAMVVSGALFLGGILAVMVLETLLLRVLTGEWVTHLGMIAGGDTQQHLAEVAVDQGMGPLSRFHTAFLELKLIGPLWIWMLVIASIAYGWVGDRSTPVLLFTVWSFAYLTWGTTSISSYNPLPIQPRYYAMVFVPASVVIARVLAAMASPIRSPRIRTVLAAGLIGALFIGEVARNRQRAGDIYAAWMARGVEEAYRSASLRRPDLKVVLSPDYGWAIDGMFLEAKPENLVSLHSWDERRRPEPPFLFVDLGMRFEEAKLRRFVGQPVSISTYDLIYPRKRLERLWSGIRGFFMVGAEPPSSTWYWHMHETLVLLVEPGVQPESAERIIHSAPLSPDRPMKVRRTAEGHVLSWPAQTKSARAQYFDQRVLEAPPTHDGSKLPETDCLSLRMGYDALAGDMKIRSILHAYTSDGRHVTSPELVIDVPDGAKRIASHGIKSKRMNAFRISFQITPKQGEAGQVLIGPPRIVPCE